MKLLNFLINSYINCSVHVAFAVCSLVGVTSLEFEINIVNNLVGFVFFGTIAGYNFVKYATVYKKGFKVLHLYLKVVQVVSVIALFYFALQLSWNVLLVFGGLALLTFFYAVPLIKHKNLRNYTGLKIKIVAFVWAGVTVLLPIINEGVQLDTDIWITFFQRFLFVFTLTLPFEMRDLQYDDLSLKTLPQRVGIKKTKNIGIVLLFFGVLIELFKDTIQLNYFLSLVIISIVLLVFLLKSRREQSKYFSSFWVESIPILWIGVFGFLQIYFNIS